jgi:DNA polymerase IV
MTMFVSQIITENPALSRTILHLDLDAFFCSVEEQLDPTLKGKPFAVGGAVEGRGVVSSCSYAARQFGVRSAMPMGRALALCPELITLRTHFAEYRKASLAVMDCLHVITPLVEQISIDEAFLDVSDLHVSGRVLAETLQRQIRDELTLPCSLGIASNKLVAKIATDVGKMRVKSGESPSAICEVPPGREGEFLSLLPVAALWGVGPKTEERLASLGICTIGDIAAQKLPELMQRFGKHGHDLWRHAQGIDDRPIVTERAAKSVSKETTFAQDVRDKNELLATLTGQVKTVCKQLQKEGVCGSVVKLKIRWPNFTTLTRQASVPATSEEAAVLPVAERLFMEVWTDGQPVRLIGVGVGGLDVPQQLSLWDTRPAEEAEREKRVQTALAALEAKFGPGLVKRASEMGKKKPSV